MQPVQNRKDPQKTENAGCPERNEADNIVPVQKGEKIPAQMLFPHHWHNPAKAELNKENANEYQVDKNEIFMDGIVGAGKSRQQNFQLLVDDGSAVAIIMVS